MVRSLPLKIDKPSLYLYYTKLILNKSVKNCKIEKKY